MATLNKVLLTGNVVRDFEQKTEKLGVLTIVQDIWNGKENIANFYNVALVGEKQCTSAMNVVKKGANITVEGMLENNSYTNSDGKKITTLQIKAFSFYLNKFSNQQKDDSQEVTDEDVNQDIDWNKVKF